MYWRFIILAGAVAFAFVWVTTSPRETPKKKISVDSDSDPVLESFWKELESTSCTVLPDDGYFTSRTATQHMNNNNQHNLAGTGNATSSSYKQPNKSIGTEKDDACELDLNKDDGIADDDDTTATKSRFTNGSWADEPDEDNLDFLPPPTLNAETTKRKHKNQAATAQGKGGSPTAPSSDNAGQGGEEKPKVHRVNPRQVYVGGLPFKTTEEDIQEFFSTSCGSVELVKLLKHPDGKSRGVAFVTFTAVESAHTALQFHDQDYEGRLLTVRITNPDQNKPPAEKKKWPNPSPNASNPAAQAASRAGRLELDKLLQQMVEETPLTLADFDFQARKMLITLLKRSPERCEECLAVIKHYTASKDRDSVRNWRGYVYTLLNKQEPELAEELRGKRGGKGEGRGSAGTVAEEERQKMQ